MESQSRKFMCKLCGNNFSTSSNLGTHLENFHKQDLHSKGRYSCKLCDKTFWTILSLSKHLENIHKQVERSRAGFVCEKCDKIYATKSFLDAHEKDCSKKHLNTLKCPLCKVEGELIDLYSHFLNKHGIKVESEKLHFESSLDFEKWKHKMEKDTDSKYILSTGSKQLAGQKTCYYYRCHKTGLLKPPNGNLHRPKMLGCNKIDGHCPAKLQVVKKVGGKKITVTYVKTHIGHTMDIEKVPLSKPDRANLEEKIKNKVPFNKIVSLAKDNKSDSDQTHLLTKKDLYNIREALTTKNEIDNDSGEEDSKLLQEKPSVDSPIQHINDFIVINQSWVKKMQDADNGCLVRFLKNQGEIDKNYPDLGLNDFLMIIMNKVQLEFLIKYGHHCLCIDTLHEQNFKLTTLFVLNSEGQGLPCLFAVSNRTETIVYKIIFHVLKLCLNGKALTPKVLVTDMTGNFYLAWLNIMGPVKFRLYCTWHVDKAWRENLIPKIQNKESQEYAYKCLRTLLEQQDQAAFEGMVKNFLMDLETSSEFKEFLVDFRTSFFGCRRSWATCYRKSAEVDCGAMERIHCEMHEELGNIYLKNEDAKQLDKAIDLLLRHVNIKSMNKEQQYHKLSDTIQRHKSMLAAQKNFCVIDETDEKWFVPCVNLNKIFTVQTSSVNCNCNVRCDDCNACIHAYVCSCPDSCKNGNMCKHIHLVCTSLAQDRMEVQGKKCGSTDDENSTYSEEIVRGGGGDGEAEPKLPVSYLKNKLQNTFNRILRRVDGMERFEIVRTALIAAFDEMNSIVK